MTKPILFGLAALILAGTGFYYRSANTKQAQIQADRIVQQDAAGADTTSQRAALAAYVKTHTGASVDITLNAAYTRAQAAAKTAAAASAANSQIYAAAQAQCSGKSDSITQARCNQDYIAKHLVNLPAATPVVEPKLADYQYHLVSPGWAADLPGALLIGAVAAALYSLWSFIKSRRRR